MPVPTHFRFTFRGDFLGTPEHWSFGLHYRRNIDLGPDASLDDINEGTVTTAVQDFFGNGFARIPSNVKLTDWRAYVIGTDGRAEGNVKVVDTTADGIIGQTGFLYPPQVTLCVTKVSDNRGPGKLGRFYLPTCIPIASDMRASASEATATAGVVSQFLKDISDAIDIPGSLISSPAVNVSKVGGGALQDVDHLEVGRALDTLRSRRGSLLEERVTGGQIDW